jgi:cell division cycle 14
MQMSTSAKQNISDLTDPVTILQDRLVFCSFPEGDQRRDDPSRVYLCSDASLVYEQFFADFGPLNIACVIRFTRQLAALLSDPEHESKLIVYFSSDHPHRRTNAAFLILCFSIIELKRNVLEAYSPFLGFDFAPFRDAAFSINTFPLTLLSAVRGLARAMSLGHFEPSTFDVEEYLRLEKIENGDVSWIVPGKFLAFSGPLSQRREIEPGVHTLDADDYALLFQTLGVTAVVRFNKKQYDRRKFIDAGINHYDLFYEDGGNPSEEIMQQFIKLCEGEKGAVAVHCKAGLGRTGTNIAAYMMKHWGYTAAEATAWLRICRPGSVVGPQQQFVQNAQMELWKQGDALRAALRTGQLDSTNSTSPMPSPKNSPRSPFSASSDESTDTALEVFGSFRGASMNSFDCSASNKTKGATAISSSSNGAAYRNKSPTRIRKTNSRRQLEELTRRTCDTDRAITWGWGVNSKSHSCRTSREQSQGASSEEAMSVQGIPAGAKSKPASPTKGGTSSQ